ncbi:MAG: 4Fe-4S ferredoxin [Gammaproteobacteria bacterium HGW-Gammaproteobacteria-1]|jgi:thioredoxin reductase/Pyruvate/2-oxoacid:ferredoxin oxidoreductase delta subunit|nr:MAG: 4Fe-4S ferredoxin [Gammaproteobacteria bacterium HGW-Gammaproteobacteria-1]
MDDTLLWSFYASPLLAILGWYIYRYQNHERVSITTRDEAIKSGLTEPASLHPVINPVKCIGCGSCVAACPEHNVLGLINKRSHLINPSHCIGHGACERACPVQAITLVFGTEKRGIDIPSVNPDFQTNVPGMFIAGELGGMGLIRNAITQGTQALESIRKLDGIGRGDRLDVIIVGAGPAGFAASLGAMQHKLRYTTIEQDSLGGTVAHFPRGKVVMTAPVNLPLVGKVKFTETSKEALLGFWQKVEREKGVKINYQERVEDIVREEHGFTVRTNKTSYRTRAVLLTIGRRGTPRTLDVPGEEQAKVVYRLIDAEQYRGQHVLVVGGGDSALEAATSIAEQPGTTVTLSYRSGSFNRAKEKNRQKVDAAVAAGRLKVMFNSGVKHIHSKTVDIEQEGTLHSLPNDAIIVSAGGILPTPFLKQIGIEVETKYGTA